MKYICLQNKGQSIYRESTKSKSQIQQDTNKNMLLWYFRPFQPCNGKHNLADSDVTSIHTGLILQAI